jgi:hypothetical protein
MQDDPAGEVMSDQMAIDQTSDVNVAVPLSELGKVAAVGDANVVSLPTYGRETVATVTPLAKLRDFSSAIELVEEAREAIRIAEERNHDLERQLKKARDDAANDVETMKHLQKASNSEINQLRAQVAAAESRAEQAERRAVDAEEWLCRLHDTVMNSLGRVVGRPAFSRPSETTRSSGAVG